LSEGKPKERFYKQNKTEKIETTTGGIRLYRKGNQNKETETEGSVAADRIKKRDQPRRTKRKV
jgi:hypothetical protein